MKPLNRTLGKICVALSVIIILAIPFAFLPLSKYIEATITIVIMALAVEIYSDYTSQENNNE